MSEIGPLSEAAEVVTMPVEAALEKFKEYKAALRVGRSQHDRMMKATYGALAKGLGVINARAAIIKAGINEEGYPKLAICRADYETVFFLRNSETDAFFSTSDRNYLRARNVKAQQNRQQFHFAENTLPTLEPRRVIQAEGTPNQWVRRVFPAGYFNTVKATVPIVPPAHRPAEMKLGEYSILWEVDKWEALPRPQRAPGDPMLLKPLGQSGLYAVMAHWDLTDIERMVLGAMYGS